MGSYEQEREVGREGSVCIMYVIVDGYGCGVSRERNQDLKNIGQKLYLQYAQLKNAPVHVYTCEYAMHTVHVHIQAM